MLHYVNIFPGYTRGGGGDWGKCGEMGKVNTTIKLVLLGELLSTELGCKWDEQRRF